MLHTIQNTRRAYLLTAKCAGTQELPSILWSPKVHYRVHKRPSLVPILTQIDPVHTIPFCPSKIRLKTVKPVLNGISRAQNIFPLKPSFRLVNVYYDSHRT
jgi:hypothetical protein